MYRIQTGMFENRKYLFKNVIIRNLKTYVFTNIILYLIKFSIYVPETA